MRFPVVPHTDDGQHYGVTVPDLPGCYSAGDSIDDALIQVLEAIDLHLEGRMDDDAAELPKPRPINVHQQNPDYANGIWAVVDFDTSKYEGKAEKINITEPRKLLSKIDASVSNHPGETRSGFMARAALQVIRGKAA